MMKEESKAADGQDAHHNNGCHYSKHLDQKGMFDVRLKLPVRDLMCPAHVLHHVSEA